VCYLTVSFGRPHCCGVRRIRFRVRRFSTLIPTPLTATAATAAHGCTGSTRPNRRDPSRARIPALSVAAPFARFFPPSPARPIVFVVFYYYSLISLRHDKSTARRYGGIFIYVVYCVYIYILSDILYFVFCCNPFFLMDRYACVSGIIKTK